MCARAALKTRQKATLGTEATRPDSQNMILRMKNAVNGADSGVAARIAAETAARRTNYAQEVRALLDAALEVIAENGTAAKARVADIVAVAGLSNDAFYRHFPSKDALVAALIEDGAERVASVVGHQMAKESTPELKVRRWLDGMLSQVAESHAASTVAVLANSSNFNTALPTGNHVAKAPLARLLHEPFAMLGSPNPELTADLVTHAVMGRVSGHLWAGTRPTDDEIGDLLHFCLAAAGR